MQVNLLALRAGLSALIYMTIASITRLREPGGFRGEIADAPDTLEAYALNYGGALRAVPRAVLRPEDSSDPARALSFAHRHYHESISVETLARQAAMSTSAFHRAFKRVTGESPLQYVKKLRLNKARTLLVHQDVAVSDAAFQVGYESPAQFSRDFRRYFGAPPSQARGTGYSLLSSGRS